MMQIVKLLVLLGSFSFLHSCHDYDKDNYASAQKAFARLHVGMSHKDACWYAGTSCDEERSEQNYALDVGQSFTKHEYILTLAIRDGKLARVQIVKPRYVGKQRQGSDGEVVMQKGTL